MELGERIGSLRRKKGWTQERLAEELGVSRQAAAKWESGTAVPELEKLTALCDLFQVSLEELVRGNPGCSQTQRCVREPETDALIAFLLRTAKTAYAGKGAEVDKPAVPSMHEYRCTEGEYTYWDRYFGGERFAGEETLFMGSECVWAMNYCGRTLADDFPADFLKAALWLRPAEAPFRGPAFYRDGRNVYINETNGIFDWFSGREAIYRDERRVYECVYHGGRTV